MQEFKHNYLDLTSRLLLSCYYSSSSVGHYQAGNEKTANIVDDIANR